jgi:hypothetical protein
MPCAMLVMCNFPFAVICCRKRSAEKAYFWRGRVSYMECGVNGNLPCTIVCHVQFPFPVVHFQRNQPKGGVSKAMV